jgi:hypothetical protein
MLHNCKYIAASGLEKLLLKYGMTEIGFEKKYGTPPASCVKTLKRLGIRCRGIKKIQSGKSPPASSRFASSSTPSTAKLDPYIFRFL